MDNDSIVISHNDITIYKTDIDLLCDEYISDLPIPDLIYTKVNVFSGLLNYIYSKTVKNVLDTDKTRFNNYELLNDIFYNLYFPLCSKYNKTPTVLAFCVLTGIDYDNLLDIKNGSYHPKGYTVNVINHSIVKKWFKSCESSLVNKTVDENGIGSMFLLKSVYGYTEQQNITVINQIDAKEDPKAIAEKYKSVAIPEKPEI